MKRSRAKALLLLQVSRARSSRCLMLARAGVGFPLLLLAACRYAEFCAA
ncbi:hypothetical protein [Treponema endosymbiont of Eucomonympha sp.]|nr:hypothetical protein [Treponema endosymbiont of Eucomonympha sp.]